MQRYNHSTHLMQTAFYPMGRWI